MRPGDWIIGDQDGVMVLPESPRDAVVAAARTRFEKETRIAELVRAGSTVQAAAEIAAAAVQFDD